MACLKYVLVNLFTSNLIRKEGRLMWKICILFAKCASSIRPPPIQQNNNMSINHYLNNVSGRLENCNEFKKSLLDIPRHHRFYTSLHENVGIEKSEKKGYYARIKENTDAFNILGVEDPIAFIEFDPLEYQWRRLPTFFERYMSTTNYILHLLYRVYVQNLVYFPKFTENIKEIKKT